MTLRLIFCIENSDIAMMEAETYIKTHSKALRGFHNLSSGKFLKKAVKIHFTLTGAAWVLAIVFILLLNSCSNKKIIASYFTDSLNAEQDKPVKISWNFINADRVKVQGDTGDYSPFDSYKIKTDSSRKIVVTAYRGNSDSLSLESVLNVINTVQPEIKAPSLIISGEAIFRNYQLPASKNTSAYLDGISESVSAAIPARIKVMRYIYPTGASNYINLNSILIDEKGNFIKGYSGRDENSSWIVKSECDSSQAYHPITRISEYPAVNDTSCLEVTILTDVSAAAADNKYLPYSIREILSDFSPDDRLQFSVFNQDYNILINSEPFKKAVNFLEVCKMPLPSGFNALNKAAFRAVHDLKNSPGNNKALVIITYNSDNSSFIYSSGDPASEALKANIPVYIIAIGQAVDTYFLKYLCSLCGGRFYYLPENNIENVIAIIREIILSRKYYYSIEYADVFNFRVCPNIKSAVTFEEDSLKLNDAFKIIRKNDIYRRSNKFLAAFDKSEIVPADFYNNNISNLAGILIGDRTLKIELFGTASSEGTAAEMKQISEKRALTVKNMLLSMGVGEEQVLTRGISNTRPLYYLESEPWQVLYNRRVEMRLLESSLLPYELLLESCETESLAEIAVEKWEKINLRVYYERYYNNSAPAYAIKAWGFSTAEEAKRLAADINKRYKINALIE